MIARPNQLTPSNEKFWKIWLALAGRGWGKTRAFSEDIFWYAYKNPGVICGVIAPSHQNCLDICFRGSSGLFNVIPSELILRKSEKPVRVSLTNGSEIIGLTAEEPEKMRGFQFNRVWCDEFASWRYIDEMWDQINMCTRLGENPQIIISTTPRPLELLRKISKDENTIVVSGSSFENTSLPNTFLENLKLRYDGTAKGRQEIYAEILDDFEGALFTYDMIRMAKKHDFNLTVDEMRSKLSYVVIGVDPAVTSTENSDETGIIVCGYDGNSFYVLEDASGTYATDVWAFKVSELWTKWRANNVIVETNQGGDLVISNLKSFGSKYIKIQQIKAKDGKRIRAEPVATLYAQNKVYHIEYNENSLEKIERQMISFTGDKNDKSPDRLDALVYGLQDCLDRHTSRKAGFYTSAFAKVFD